MVKLYSQFEKKNYHFLYQLHDAIEKDSCLSIKNYFGKEIASPLIPFALGEKYCFSIQKDGPLCILEFF